MALISLNNLERFFNNLKTYISNALNSKVDSNNLKTINNNSLVGTGNITITASSVDWDNVNNKPSTFTPSTHTHAASDITSGLATVATSGSYNDLSNKPTIPTVNNATLKIQKNGTDVKTFTANASSDVTCNITVPTKVSELTNDSGFLTSHQDLSGYIPLTGTSALAGSIVPSTDNSVDLGTSSKNIKMIYTKGITINGTQFLPSDYVTLNDAQTIPGNKTFSGLTKTTGKLPYSYLGNDLNNAIYNMETTYWGPDTANRPSSSDYGTLLSFNREVNVHTSYGIGWLAQFGIGTDSRLYLRTKSNTYASWENWKEFITINDVVPRSGGAVMTGEFFGKNNDYSELKLGGGTTDSNSTTLSLFGKDAYSQYGLNGALRMFIRKADLGQLKTMLLYPSGTWTWDGTACQITSDKRLKQQITEIDDKLLDAWEDVDLVQFKYNDAVEEKSDNARLHTGYVVQQIDEACKSHGVDISEYGLYCHEEYPERTEEVEVQQEDGTTKKETKVIEEAKEHYSLRYTEALIVECAFLRRENKRLNDRLTTLEELLNNILLNN